MVIESTNALSQAMSKLHCLEKFSLADEGKPAVSFSLLNSLSGLSHVKNLALQDVSLGFGDKFQLSPSVKSLTVVRSYLSTSFIEAIRRHAQSWDVLEIQGNGILDAKKYEELLGTVATIPTAEVSDNQIMDQSYDEL
jgi:hypothetical protein